MAKAHYDEAKVIKQLSRKGIKINTVEKKISIPQNPITPIGIRSYGKLDYLKNYCGYVIFGSKVDVFAKESEDNNENNKKRNKKENNTPKVKKYRKNGNKENNFNLAKQVKDIMKKVKKH